ncbi:rCG54781 [Rattus norvegicus]|uniref:RCG54781 n=1 Tax=Rattus norvegicus TaxID=10116 RepID=A6IID2_RAT|nr:rCG54781 [Rattus norvegicus]
MTAITVVDIAILSRIANSPRERKGCHNCSKSSHPVYDLDHLDEQKRYSYGEKASTKVKCYGYRVTN